MRAARGRRGAASSARIRFFASVAPARYLCAKKALLSLGVMKSLLAAAFLLLSSPAIALTVVVEGTVGALRVEDGLRREGLTA